MISICITQYQRSFMLPEFAKCTQRIKDVEVIVADWDDIAYPAGWEVVPMASAFSRGRGLNAAAEHASHEKLFFCDIDCLFRPQLFDEWDGVNPYFPIMYSLGAYETAERFWQCYDAGIEPHKSRFHGNTQGGWRPSSYGMVLTTKANHNKTGGWIEKESWGKEDEWYYEKCEDFNLNPYRYHSPNLVHRWHGNRLEYRDKPIPQHIQDVL